MLTKISAICYIYNSTECQITKYTVKDITGIVRLIRLSDDDSKKIMYLKIKTFVPIDTNIRTKIENCEKED
ncbi:10093_t:CDS:1, partial [Diversispora eburnea]